MAKSQDLILELRAQGFSNAEIGRRIARENAINKVWPLLGFRLRDELARPVLTEGDVAADAAGTCRPDNHTSACTACKRA